MKPSFTDYLNSQKAIFFKYHPQWDLTNEEISASSDLLKRDGTPICIPPSWDLIQKYCGPYNPKASGYDMALNQRKKYLFAGDRAEKEFLNMMQHFQIGGILVGDVNSYDLLNMENIDGNKGFRLPTILCDQIKEGDFSDHFFAIKCIKHAYLQFFQKGNFNWILFSFINQGELFTLR